MARNKLPPKQLARKRARKSARRGENSKTGAPTDQQTQQPEIPDADPWDVNSIGGAGTVAATRGKTAIVPARRPPRGCVSVLRRVRT